MPPGRRGRDEMTVNLSPHHPGEGRELASSGTEAKVREIPAFAGMTEGARMTEEAGMTDERKSGC